MDANQRKRLSGGIRRSALSGVPSAAPLADNPFTKEVGMSDKHIHVEESERSWTSRIGGAMTGLVLGGLIFLAAFPLLFWNEGRAVKRYKTLKEGAGSVVTASPDKVDPAHEGKLIHVTATAQAPTPLTDTLMGGDVAPIPVSPQSVDPTHQGKVVFVSGPLSGGGVVDDITGVFVNALVLERRVSMFQWRETQGKTTTDKKVGGKEKTTTEYLYDQVWSDRPIPSTGFKQREGHANPASFPIPSATLKTSEARVGAFRVDPALLDALPAATPPPIGQTAMNIPTSLAGRVHQTTNGLFIGSDPSRPRVGDLMVTYTIAKPGDVGIVALQSGGVLTPISLKDGRRADWIVRGATSPVHMGVGLSLSAPALKLKRTVSLYQWRETMNTRSSGPAATPEASYTSGWEDAVVDSTAFVSGAGHANPPRMPFPAQTLVAAPIRLGAFTLPPEYVGKLDRFDPLAGDALRQALPAEIRDKVRMTADGVFIGENPQAPAVGDLKISYAVVRSQPVTVVARQSDATFSPYKTETGLISEFRPGTLTAQEVFGKAQRENATMTWILRLVGFAAMFLGLVMVFKPLSVVADVVPFIGAIVAKGAAFIAFFLALFCALLTMALAWIFYRPVLAIGLVLVAVAGIFLIRSRKGGDIPPPPRPPVRPPIPPSDGPPPAPSGPPPPPAS